MTWNAIRTGIRGVVCVCCTLMMANAAVAQNNVPDVFTDKKTAGIIPFDYYPPHIQNIIIKVSINGASPMPFILDTGSSLPITLSPEAAKKLHISTKNGKNLAENILIADIKSATVPMRTADGKSKSEFCMGGKAQAAILDEPSFYSEYQGAPVAGIVGATLFANSALQLDFAAKVVRVSMKPHKPLHIPGATMLPLTCDPIYHYYISLNPPEGKPVSFMLDTGADMTIMPREVASRYQARNTYETTDATEVHSKTEEREAILPTLTIGDDTETNIIASYPEAEKEEGEAILGMNVLTRFRITMDFVNKQVFFERGADYKERVRLPAYQEFEIEVRGGKYFVSHVESGYAADRAGLAEGDRIVEADGVALKGLSAERVRNLVFGFANTAAHLVLEREGKRRNVDYTRYGLNALVAYPPVGVGMGIMQALPDTIVIYGVLEDTPAKEAGLEAGDVIVTINGKPVKEMCFEAIVVALNGTEGMAVSLEVRSKGATTSRSVTLTPRRLSYADKSKQQAGGTNRN